MGNSKDLLVILYLTECSIVYIRHVREENPVHSALHYSRGIRGHITLYKSRLKTPRHIYKNKEHTMREKLLVLSNFYFIIMCEEQYQDSPRHFQTTNPSLLKTAYHCKPFGQPTSLSRLQAKGCWNSRSFGVGFRWRCELFFVHLLHQLLPTLSPSLN